MTDQELKYLSRSELLEMLIAQVEENEILRTQLEEAQSQLESRLITISTAGSIAEAALSLNGVFEAADAAARQYLDNLQTLYGQYETVCKQMEAHAKHRADTMVAQAQAYSRQVHAEADNYWKQICEQAQSLLRNPEFPGERNF